MSSLRLSVLKRVAHSALLLGLAGCGFSGAQDAIKAGDEAYNLRDLLRAEKCYQQACDFAPDGITCKIKLAKVKLDLAKIGEADSIIKEAVALDPEAVDSRLLGAQIAWYMKSYDEAFKAFSSIAEDTSLSKEIRAEAYSSMGVVEMTKNRSDEARVLFMTALLYDYRNPPAWYHLGCLYRDVYGYDASALEQFEVFVRLEKNDPHRVLKVSREFIPGLKDKINLKLTEINGASSRDSAKSATLIRKAESEVLKKKFQEALMSYKEAYAADPLSYPAAKGLAEMWIKEAIRVPSRREGDVCRRKALKSYRDAIMLRPSATSLMIEAAGLALRLGDTMTAFEIYSRAMAVNPTNRSAIDGVIKTAELKGKVALAKLYKEYLTKVKTVR